MTSPSPLPPSTANWHWKNKNVGAWAKTWFQQELTAISIKGDGDEFVKISDVTTVDGDVELGQRKSKLITIYDVKIQLQWEGKASDGTDVSGTLTIPEVSHEVTLDGLSDYEYKWNLKTESSKPVDALYKLAKTKLPTALEVKFAEFPVAIIDTHGRDLTISTDTSRTGTPAPTAAPPAAKAATAAAPSVPVKKPEPKTVNTTTLTVEAAFMASADDLFSILTDEKRIPSWSRAPAKSTAKAGSEYSLFGGGVNGKYVTVTPGKEIVQTWALKSPTWPSGHDAILITTFKQGSDSTTVTFTLNDVPLGSKDEIKRNIEGYYVHGLKSIGYVQLVMSDPPRRRRSRSPVETAPSASSSSRYVALGLAALALIAAFSIPYVYK